MGKNELSSIVSQIVSPKLNADERSIITTSKIQLPDGSNGHLSPSQIGMYLRCARQYWFRYVKGVVIPPAVALVEGGSHHSVLESNNKHKIKTGSDRSAKYLCEEFCDTFSDEQKEIPKTEWIMSGEKKDDVIKRGVGLQTKYRSDFAPLLKPTFVEHELRFKVGGVEVLGYLDVGGVVQLGKLKSKSVVDYKVAGRKKSEAEINNSIALSFYGWGAIDLFKGANLKTNPPSIAFCILKKTKQPAIEYQPTKLLVGRIKWFRSLVLSVANSISCGSFPVCDPINWCCSEKFCGFYSRCKGKVWKG